MELPLTCASGPCEQRSVIRFLTAEEIPAANIYRRLLNVYGTSAMPSRTVRSWVNKFKAGRNHVHDDDRSGRPSDAVNEETTAGILALFERDRRYTISDLHVFLKDEFLIDVSRASICRVLREAGYTKVCARWVPRLLSHEHRTNRLEAALSFLTAYHDDPTILSRVVTGDESWVHYVTPETKNASKVWKRKNEPTPKKARLEKSAHKLMVTVFWDQHGILLVEFMDRGTTINSERYCEILDKLRKAIKNKRPGLLTRQPFFFHDNARPHTSRLTTAHLQKFKWEVFGHPPYSPDMAPSDYHLFPRLKGWLGSQRFANDEELKQGVTTYLQKLDAEFFRVGIEKLVTRYDKCLNVNGDYVEK